MSKDDTPNGQAQDTLNKLKDKEKYSIMSKAWNSSGGSFEQAPIGIHEAVCIRVIDLGTQEGEYKGEKTKRRQNLITWELPNELREDGQPFIISKFYTASLGEKANLYKDLTGWLGKAPQVPFDPTSLLGKPCQLSITERNDKHVVSTVVQAPKSAKSPAKTHNETLFFSLDEFNQDTFDKVPDGIQKMIMKSPEYYEIATETTDTKAISADEDFDF